MKQHTYTDFTKCYVTPSTTSIHPSNHNSIGYSIRSAYHKSITQPIPTATFGLK